MQALETTEKSIVKIYLVDHIIMYHVSKLTADFFNIQTLILDMAWDEFLIEWSSSPLLKLFQSYLHH